MAQFFLSPEIILTLCIRGTPKPVLMQTENTQMKCSTMLHFIMFYTVCKLKTSSDKNTIFYLKNYNRTPLDMYSRLFHVYRITPEGRFH